MAEQTQQIFELQLKFNGLLTWARHTNRAHLRSEHTVAESIDVHRSTLKSSLRNERMSTALQKALADAFGFSVDWGEWHDSDAANMPPTGRRRDTAAAFLKRFSAGKARAACLTIESGLIDKSLDRRFADFSLAVAGSYQPHSHAEGIPLVLSLSFDRRGWPILLGDTNEVVTVGLKQADVQIFHTRQTATLETSNISCRSEAEGNFQGNVEGLSPWWVITVTGNDLWLMGRRLRNDGCDCACRGFQVGDTLRVVMTARVNDCFVRVPSDPLEKSSEAKLKFIEHLHKLAVLNGTEAVLGEQKLTVIDKS